MQQFIIYTDSNEVLITTPDLESETIRLYFTEGGRTMDDYDRDIVSLNSDSPALQIRMIGMSVSS